MWSVALVYYGGVLLVFCLGGWLSERYLFQGSPDIPGQIDTMETGDRKDRDMSDHRIYVERNVHGSWDVYLKGGTLHSPIKLAGPFSESEALAQRNILRERLVVLGGWLGERYLLLGQKHPRRSGRECTCENHGVWLCEECFPLDEWGIPTVR